MSSKLYRAGKDANAEPIAWRRHAGGLTQASAAPAVGPKENSADREREMEARAAAAYQKGLTAGESAATQKANARMEPVFAGLNAVIAELANTRRRFRAGAEEATVALAIAIARRVLNRELATDPEAILGLVKAAFQKCDARETYRLRVFPADAQALHEHRARLNIPPAVEIVADKALTRGSAVFETARGELDASVDTQLIEIERGFADILDRRRSI